jgi:AraC-like DNA-binding protein
MAWSRVSTFTDPFQCQSALQSADQAEILPTARGSFHVELTQIAMDKLRMQRFTINLPQVVMAAKTSDRQAIAFLLERSSSSLQHCGIEVTPHDIVVYDHDVLHQRSTFDYHLGTMSVPLDDFPALCETIAGSVSPDRRRHPTVRPDPALLSRLRKLHKAVGQLAHDTPDILDMPEVRRALEEQLIHVMVRCLAEGAGVEATMSDRRHNAVVARFEEFLEANPDRPLYLTEICPAIGVAERTLRAACEEHLGMGPIRFLTLRRMHLVRRALLHAHPSEATVTRIVTDQGFWELGRFSVAYRALFGESPSETLRRSSELASSSPLAPRLSHRKVDFHPNY